MRVRFFAVFVVAFGLLLFGVGCGSPNAPKTDIVYTFAGAANGSLGNMTFTDAPFTLVVIADKLAVTPSTNPCAVPAGVCQIFSAPATTVKFSLTNQNVTATFTSTAGMFLNQTIPHRRSAATWESDWRHAGHPRSGVRQL